MGTIGPLGRKPSASAGGRFHQGMAFLGTTKAYLCINDLAGIQTATLDSHLRGNDETRKARLDLHYVIRRYRQQNSRLP
jgi:hypothetical protein